MKKLKWIFIYPLFSIFSLFSFLVNSQTPDVDGKWSAPIGFDIVPVAVANLPDGRLLTWAASKPTSFVEVSTGATYSEIFDPSLGVSGQATGQFVSNLNHDMFCPGINLLPDGRIMAAGGATSDRTSIFDPATGLWTPADRMNIPRGYQGNATLSDGSVFTIGGSWADGNTPSTNGQKDAEQWSPLTGWFKLPGILGADIFTANDLLTEARGLYRVDSHLWLWPAPNGQLFHAGPSEEMHWIDVSNGGSITSAGLRGTDTYSAKGTTVMFDIGKLLKVGGAESYDSGHPAKNTAFVIDINDPANVTVTPTANTLEFSRTMHNSVVLPTGEVLVTGGLDQARVFSDVGARFGPEIYNPVSNSWRTVAGMDEARTYHSVSILMFDGRVFAAGGGLCDDTPGCINHQSAEIYSPPYLFTTGGALATRPVITAAPDEAGYGDIISVTTDSNVDQFSLIRFSGATHSTNNEQRRIPIATTSGTAHNLTIPGRNLLPPGYYMLFALNANGVPSIAKSIKIGNAVPLDYNPNLVLNLDFEEGTGTTAADSSGNGNDATIKERDDNGIEIAPTQNYWGTGLFGNSALEMDGLEFNSNTILEVPFSTTMASIESEITVMAWVYRDEIKKNNGIFTHDYPAIFFGFHNSLYKWEFPSSTGDNPHCYAGYSPARKWVHIAATFDGKTAKLYANGTEICSKAVTGTFNLEKIEEFYSSFTTSGFYEHRATPVVPTGNSSGITDEIDGRIDELKVFKKALGEEEIKMFFELGQQTGNQDVPNCPEGTIIAEYKVGASGTWTQGNFVVANEGDQVFIRAQTTGEYFITTHQLYSPTFSSTTTPEYQIDTNVNIIQGAPPYDNPDRNNGLVDQSNNGQFVLTTANGCPTVITLKVLGSCDPGETEISPEYRINGIWHTGENEINLETGDELVLSVLPNEVSGNPLKANITLPNGLTVVDNFNLGPVSKQEHEGTYVFISEQGCSTTLKLNIEDPQDGCFNYLTNENPLFPLNRGAGVAGLDGISGISSDTNGSPCALELVQNDNGDPFARYRITINLAHSGLVEGDELFISIDGKGVTGTPRIELTVDNTANTSLLSHSFGTDWSTHSGVVTVPSGTETLDIWLFANYTGQTAGTSLYDNLVVRKINNRAPTAVLGTSATEGEVPFTVDFTGSGSTDDVGVTSYQWDFGDGNTSADADPSHEFNQVGTYNATLTVTDIDGNMDSENTTIKVLPASDCSSIGLETQYKLNNSGSYITGQSEVTIDAGSTIALGILPNDVQFAITSTSLSGNSKPLNLSDLTLANLDENDEGLYTFTTSASCQVTLQVNINTASQECTTLNLVPEYYLNNGAVQLAANGETLLVDYGNSIRLSALPSVKYGTDVPVTITLPDGSIQGDDYEINSLELWHSGTYVFTSENSCVATLILKVTLCNVLNLMTEASVNGAASSSFQDNGTLILNTGDDVILSATPDMFDGFEVGLASITLPDGTVQTDNFEINDIQTTNSGLYLFTTDTGCTARLNLTVNGAPECTNSSITPEYVINDRTTQSGGDSVPITEGDKIVLRIVQDGEFTITLPNGTVNNGTLTLGEIEVSQAGDYVFTSAEGCTAQLGVIVNTISQKGILIYPNPIGANDGMLTFSLRDFMNEDLFVSFYDIRGKLVQKKRIPEDHGQEVDINVSILSTGTYLVEIRRTLKDEKIFKKVIKL